MAGAAEESLTDQFSEKLAGSSRRSVWDARVELADVEMEDRNGVPEVAPFGCYG